MDAGTNVNYLAQAFAWIADPTHQGGPGGDLGAIG